MVQQTLLILDRGYIAVDVALRLRLLVLRGLLKTKLAEKLEKFSRVPVPGEV